MNLDEIRTEIDEIDAKLLELFRQRMDLVKDVAEYKIRHQMQVLRPERERAILQMVRENAGEEYGDYAVDFFDTVLRVSREMQQQMIAARKSDENVEK